MKKNKFDGFDVFTMVLLFIVIVLVAVNFGLLIRGMF